MCAPHYNEGDEDFETVFCFVSYRGEFIEAKMKVKRFLANVVVLLIFAAVVFFAGWVQFAVKPGSCVLMESKTGGLYDKPIVAGNFTWRWERLLPTNVTLTRFTLAPQRQSVCASGQLAGGELYASLLPSDSAHKDSAFSYSVAADVVLVFSAEAVHSLYSQGKIASDEDLKACGAATASLFATLLAEHLVETGRAVQNGALSQQEIRAIVQKRADEFEGVSLLSAEVTSSSVPDVALYERLKADYASFLERPASQVASQAGSESQDSAIGRLERLGEVLSKYPQLEELFKTPEGSKVLQSLNLAD